MGIFNRKRIEIRSDEPENTDNEAVMLRSALLEVSSSKEAALEIPSVAQCIDLIGSAVASLPIKLYKKVDKKSEEVLSDPRLFLLNNDTGDTLTAEQFWRAMIEDYYLGKGGYAYINTSGLSVKSIHYVDEQSVSVMKNDDPIFKDYNISVLGKSYYPHQFLKILRHTKDGMTSKSLLDRNQLQLAVAYNELKYENSLVQKGGNKKGFLQSTKHLTAQAMESLRNAFRNLYSNGDENVVVLNDGITFKESSNTSVEMQLNESKQTNAAEIAKLFGIPVGMIEGHPSAEDVSGFVRSVTHVLSDIECSLNRDLLLESEKQNYFFAFDTKELTRGDIKSRFDAYAVALDNNFMQIDEVRELEDLEPLGINWITLGLDSVLYNPETKEVYTPNTNATANMADLSTGGESQDES